MIERRSPTSRIYIDGYLKIPRQLRERSSRGYMGSIERLVYFPNIGRAGGEAGTRAWIVSKTPYIAVYEVREESDELRVLAVIHHAQDRSSSNKA